MIPKVEQLRDDDRGQLGSVSRVSRIAVGVILGLGVLALVAAFLLPVGISGIVDDRSSTHTQNVGETVNVTGVIDSTLDSTNTTPTPNEATYTLDDGDSNATHTLSVGSEQDFNLNGGTVTVGLESASSSQATANYTYSVDHGWSGGASSIWFLLDVAIVLAVMLAALGIGLKATDLV